MSTDKGSETTTPPSTEGPRQGAAAGSASKPEGDDWASQHWSAFEPHKPPVKHRVGAAWSRGVSRFVQKIWPTHESAPIQPYILRSDGSRRAPRVLFVCPGNTARSQLAELLAIEHGLIAESGGTFPAARIPTEVIDAAKERGLDPTGRRPKVIDARRVDEFDRVISFGFTVPRHITGSVPQEVWNIDDPNGLPLDGFRATRDQIEAKVQALADRWRHNHAPDPGSK